MTRFLALPLVGCAFVLWGAWASAQGVATFAGMTCSQLTDEQKAQVGEAYGEACGVYVAAVEAGSLAGKTGVKTGDVLISVRMPDETDYYPIPPDIAEMIRLAQATQATEQVRVLVLRKQDGEWVQLKGQLGTPFGDAPPAAAAEGQEGKPDCVAGGQQNFISENPDRVIAKALDGSELTQKDADIVGGILAWSFGTQLTEAQKGIVWASTVAFWQAADAQAVQQFSQGFRQMPQIIPQLDPQKRSQLQAASASVFLQMAQMDPNDPLAQVILTVAQSAAQVLAGTGTQHQLTKQDVDALLEYLCFQNQMMTGVQVVVTAEQYAEFTEQIVQHFNAASEEEQAKLSSFDLLWGQLRSAWAIAQATQQQALIDQQIQQWRQAYQQAGIYNPGAGGWANAAPQGGWGGGGGMDQSTFDTLSDVLRMEHETSMAIINNIGDGPAYDVYDSSGNWLYSY